MENKKGNSVFLGVIGVATLIVAIIGATFAYFSATTNSAEDAINAQSAQLSLGFVDNADGLKTNLIPAEYWIAEYAATNAQWIADEKQCLDEYGNEICGVYEFTIGNPSFTTAQNLYAKMVVQTNDIQDLWFKIYDEEGTEVVPATAFATASEDTGEITLTQLNQTLLASSSDSANDSFDAADPSSYTLVEKTAVDGETKQYNKRTYNIVIWIEETGVDQTTTSGEGRTFTGGITFTTAGNSTGVTGIIGAAQKPTDGGDNPGA